MLACSIQVANDEARESQYREGQQRPDDCQCQCQCQLESVDSANPSPSLSQAALAVLQAPQPSLLTAWDPVAGVCTQQFQRSALKHARGGGEGEGTHRDSIIMMKKSMPHTHVVQMQL